MGGGDTAVADAIYLSRICHKVSIIVRRDVLRATAIYNIKLRVRQRRDRLEHDGRGGSQERFRRDGHQDGTR